MNRTSEGYLNTSHFEPFPLSTTKLKHQILEAGSASTCRCEHIWFISCMDIKGINILIFVNNLNNNF